ncbi:MAG TPA: sulfite oxidase [Chloroflexia bacterium]|jgi:DMSO/TMAO reductase YedYZ molybdopterin-dependent catalytic subunit|nr:sulfite oxidase [Chloroflexia bacterium]
METQADLSTTDGGDKPLVIVKAEPLNAETPLFALREYFTPNENFYVRSNFSMPAVTDDAWRLRVSGAVARHVEFTLADLLSMPSRELPVTLECAGNGRTGFSPLPQGEPWGVGAVATALWRGVPLASILERAELSASAVEILFEGGDRGVPSAGLGEVPFARSLPLEKALHPDTLLAYEMNGAPLPRAHGGPVRLLVPGWYGMASVKWLAGITALEQPFTGFYQRERYVLDYPGSSETLPVSEMAARALITGPEQGAVVPPGSHVVAGVAWSGRGTVVSVEVSLEGGGPWRQARMLDQATPYTWRRWQFDWQPAKQGRHVLRARAVDEQGNVQPDLAPWNRLGYCNNSVQGVIVEVRA